MVNWRSCEVAEGCLTREGALQLDEGTPKNQFGSSFTDETNENVRYSAETYKHKIRRCATIGYTYLDGAINDQGGC